MSAPSLVGLNSHHAYDLRTRAITYMLAALEATSSDARTTLKPNPVILKNEAELYASPQGSNHLNSANQANSDRLKFLNQVALLLVREYEIVAVLPKRSGSQAHVDVMVTTDSDSDLDELNTGDLVQDASRPSPRIKYLVTRNPRNDSPSGKSSNASANTVEVLHALEQVTSLPNMYEYLVKYRYVSFSDHVSSIEYLLNRIIAPKSQLQSDWKLFFKRYITFRAAPKMHRRFQSPEFTSFFQALRSLSTTDIETFVASHIRSNKITTLTTKSEAHEGLVPDILYFSGFVSPEINCPHLWEQYEHHGTRADVVYTAKLASEFHQLLIYGLEKAAAAVAAFTNAYKIGSLPAHDDFLLTEVEDWMGYIHVMVHESAIFKVHVEALDREITGRMVQTLPLSNQAAPLQMRVQLSDSETKPLDANIRPFMQEDEDFDGSLSDTAIEISAAQAVSRAGQQSLWLAVSFQHAIRSLCQKQALPKRPLSLTLFNPPVANIPSTLMESWKSVIASLFPAATDDISSATGSETTESSNITAVEVIETLEAYGNDHGGKSTLFLPGRELAIKFRGVYHAESILATMAYLGASIPDTYHYESPNILGGFRNTYRTIGVSKRCCPTCTKLLSLLTPHQHDARESGEPLTVLCSHQKIYPTSLPPLLPSDVAELLITWLEELLKDELVKLVKKKRRSTGISVKSATSQDSKEKSPEKAIGPVVSPILKPRALGKTPGGGNRFVRWCGKKTAEVGEQAQGTGLKGSE